MKKLKLFILFGVCATLASSVFANTAQPSAPCKGAHCVKATNHQNKNVAHQQKTQQPQQAQQN